MSTLLDALAAATTPEERNAIKAAAYAARPAPSSLTAGNRIVSIIDGPVGENGLLKVTLALWIASGFGFELIDLGNANPFYFQNPPVLVPDPGGEVIQAWTDESGNPQEARFHEDLDTALMQACYDAT